MCGELRLEAHGEPRRVALCHCVTCRRNTGAPVGGFVIYGRDQVTIRGKHVGSWVSSDVLTRFFCSRCGSPVYSEEGDEYNVYLGAMDEAESFVPTYEIFVRTKLPWLPDLLGVESYERFREE